MLRVILVYLFSILSVNSASAGKLVFENTIFFKLNANVYDYVDLLEINKAFNQFKCLYGESALVEVLDLKKIGYKELVNKKKSSSEDLRFVLRNYLSYLKLLSFSQNSNFTIKTDIKKAFIVASKKVDCGQILLSNDRLNKEFENFLMLELFIKYKYVGSGSSETSKKTLKESIKRLIKTVERQYVAEIY